MNNNNKKSWFEDWFNSPYWPVLYSNRNDDEAKQFLDALLNYLKPAPNSTMLDLGCGTGRHAKYLSEKGFNVTGIDISEKNIKDANAFKNDKLEFYVHDMRQLFRPDFYNYIFNFFTSFGYFDDHKENLRALSVANKGLKSNGIIVIDFMNCQYVLNNLVPKEEKTVEGITFKLKRYEQNGAIIKEIAFEAEGKQYEFAERVQVLMQKDFNFLLRKTGFTIVDTFGDYSLKPFDAEQSKRLILVAKKQ